MSESRPGHGAKSGGAWDAYRGAGVDIDAGERAVELMRASVEATRRPEVIGGLGGFASAMALPAGMREPVLVSSTDGVGTKTAIAMALGVYDTDRARPGGDVRGRPGLRRCRAALLPGLPRRRARIPGAGCGDRRLRSRTAAAWPVAR